jgi:hypothetical protein
LSAGDFFVAEAEEDAADAGDEEKQEEQLVGGMG